jgi:hypothetical protein
LILSPHFHRRLFFTPEYFIFFRYAFTAADCAAGDYFSSFRQIFADAGFRHACYHAARQQRRAAAHSAVQCKEAAAVCEAVQQAVP